MPTWLSVILEIIKISVPALIVFATVYYLMKQYIDGQNRMRMLEIRQNQQKKTIPLRLQAYERLSLFCERISIPNLMLRVRNEGMSADQLRISMMIAIQQEFEHNITQQVYVSENLWKIIQIARDDAVNLLNQVHQQTDENTDVRTFSKMLLHATAQREVNPLERALLAIKKEAGLLLQ